MKPLGCVVIGVLILPAPLWADCGSGNLSPGESAAIIGRVADLVESAHFGASASDPVGYARGLDQVRSVAARGVSQRELSAGLNRALAALGDAHLEVRLAEAAVGSCRTLPVRLAWNARGLWVTAGTAAVPTGARVSRIGKLTVDDLQHVLAETVPHETVQWLRAHSADLLVREDTLAVLGVLDAEGAVEVEFDAPAGTQRHSRLLLAARTANPPPPQPGYRIHPKERTGHFWFHRFDYDTSLATTFDAFLSEAKAAGVEKVAIDIRGNPGGDSSVAIAMLDALTDGHYQSFGVEVRPSAQLASAMPYLMPDSMNPVFESVGLPLIPAGASTYLLPPPLVLAQLRSRVEAIPLRGRLEGRRLFLLTDGGTFSSGTLFAGLVRDNRLGLIVGEAAGNTATFNGSELRFDLPGSDYYLNVSSARLNRPDGQLPASESIEPDHVAIPDGADLKEGRDVALDWVLRQ